MKLIEKKENLGWNKDIVRYALKDKRHLYSIFRNVMKTSPHVVCSDTLDDIWGEFLTRLYKSADYDPERGLSIAGYVGRKAKLCALTYLNHMYKDSSMITNFKEITTDEETLSLMDIIADTKAEEAFEESTCNLAEALESIEPYRYKYGPDLFLFLYICLQDIDKSKIEEIYDVLGVSSTQITYIRQRLAESQRLRNTLRELTAAGEDALRVLGEFVFDRRGIDKCICYIKTVG